MFANWGWWLHGSTSAWRGIVEIRVRGLEGELRRVDKARRNKPDYHIATRALSEAKTGAKPPPTLLRRVLSWWSGTLVEKAWAAVREAEDSLVVVQSDEAVKVQLADAEALIADQFPRGDPRRNKYDKMLEAIEAAARKRERQGTSPLFPDGARDELRRIRAEAHQASDARMRDIRRFRNWLLLAALGLTIMLLVVGIVHAANPKLLSVCASPAASDPTPTDLCPNGATEPRAADVFEIELIGALGGMLAGLLALTRLRRAPGPYSLPSAQVLLKAPAGAATALIGVLLLQGGALAGLSRQPGSAILAYAALFGFAQQILTSLVDRQANELTQASQ